ncbi:unnamed protein product [Prunus armeniaca]
MRHKSPRGEEMVVATLHWEAYKAIDFLDRVEPTSKKLLEVEMLKAETNLVLETDMVVQIEKLEMVELVGGDG